MDDTSVDPVLRAAAYYYRNRLSFSGSFDAGFSEHAFWDRWRPSADRIQDLAIWSKQIKRWKITKLDYEAVFRAPTTNTTALIFADPPYDLSDIKADRLYCGHRQFDHSRFERIALDCTTPSMITYSHQPDRFVHWSLRAVMDHAYSMSSKKEYRHAQQKRQEMIVTNYPAPQHQYVRLDVSAGADDDALKLRSQIEAAGMTQQQAADVIGVKLRAVQRWLASDRRIPARAFFALGTYARCPRKPRTIGERARTPSSG